MIGKKKVKVYKVVSMYELNYETKFEQPEELIKRRMEGLAEMMDEAQPDSFVEPDREYVTILEDIDENLERFLNENKGD